MLESYLNPRKTREVFVVCTEKKKTFEIYVRGFRWVLLEKGKVLLFLIVLL